MVTAQPKKILHSLRFFVLRTIASLIFIPTILLLCTVSIIKPLALHNAGDRRNAVPCAALGCMKFTLVFLTLFFQRCNLHSDPTSFPVCSATPRFQLHFRPCDLWRSPASGLHPTAHLVSAVCILFDLSLLDPFGDLCFRFFAAHQLIKFHNGICFFISGFLSPLR